MSEWYDVMMDEEGGLPLDPVREDLPSDNEEKGEDNGYGSPAAGALEEEDDPDRMKDVPRGDNLVGGNNYADEYEMLGYFDEDDEKDDDDEDSGDDDDDEKENDGESDDDEDSGDDKDDDGAKDYAFFDEIDGLPVDAAKEDLPDANEEDGEDNGYGSPASGDLPEDDDPDGMTDVPRGKNLIGGDDYDDSMEKYYYENAFVDADDDKKDDNEEDDDKEDEEEKPDEDGDGGKEDPEKEDDKDTKDESEYVDDFSDFFIDADTVVPKGPAGTKLEPADPVDGDGDDICPIGNPDLPSNLTEPVIVPSDDPGYTDENEYRDSLHEDSRFGFGSF